MNNRGLFLVFSSIFIAIIIIGGVAFSVFSSGDDLTKPESYINNSEKVSCFSNEECDDGNFCTLDYCDEMEFCANTKVMLCYNNDGCCPQGCTRDNDNDCS